MRIEIKSIHNQSIITVQYILSSFPWFVFARTSGLLNIIQVSQYMLANMSSTMTTTMTSISEVPIENLEANYTSHPAELVKGGVCVKALCLLLF